MKSIVSLGFLTIIAALVIAISCQKSDNNKPEPPQPGQKEYVTASIAGRILDNNKQPVSGAKITAGSMTATSDVNGSFRITNVSLDKNAGFIKIEKDGFFEGSRTIIVNANAVNNISIELIKKKVSGTVSGSTGGNITVEGGGNIVFTGNSFVNKAGNSAYTGTVSVSTFFLNPTASNFNAIMPGALRGVTAANEETGLQSFGMMAVELTGAGGEKLQLAAGKTATLNFPIPADLLSLAPNTIPLWSFNDSTGLWKEEGAATKQGSNYVGTVSHFSFWNCDWPYGVVNFKALVKDQNGNALANALVMMQTSTDQYTTYGSGYTDSTGNVSGLIPKGKILQLKITNKCGAVLFTKDIGPFTANADLGTLTVTTAAPGAVTFSGTAKNCSLTAVTNGYVEVYLDGMYTRTAINNGNWSLTINRCNNTPTTASVIAYDLGSNQGGTSTTVQVSGTTVNAGDLSACGTSLAQFLNYTMNGVTKTFTSPADSMNSYKSGNSSYGIWVTRKSQSGDNVYLYFNATGVGSVPLSSVEIFQSPKYYNGVLPITLNITEWTAGSGGFMAGNFTGTMIDSLGTNTVPINMTFRVQKQ
jgi:hypothetical protein